MKLKNLLVVNAIVLGFSGINAVLLPAMVLSLYGVTPGPASLLMAQYAGLGSIAIGMVAWFARNIEDLKAQGAIIWQDRCRLQSYFQSNSKNHLHVNLPLQGTYLHKSGPHNLRLSPNIDKN